MVNKLNIKSKRIIIVLSRVVEGKPITLNPITENILNLLRKENYIVKEERINKEGKKIRERDGDNIFVSDDCLKEEKELKTMKINN
jgi:hypothetical protein